MTTVGFIGPGLLGSALVERVLAQGHTPLIWARHRERVEPLLAAGARWADSPAECARATDILVGTLKNDAVVAEVYRSPEGVFAHARPGSVLIEHATVSPALIVELAGEAQRAGVHLLDAPVSGGPAGARAGTLAVMVGGEAAILARARAVIDLYAATVVHVGEPGAGQSLKLINQLLVGVHAVAATEAAAMIAAQGIDPIAARQVLGAGWAGSVQLDRLLERAVAQDLRPDGAPLGGMVEVLRLVAESAQSVGVRSQLLGPTREVFERLAGEYGEAAFSALTLAAVPMGKDDKKWGEK